MADQLQSGNVIPNFDTSQQFVYGISQRGGDIINQSGSFQVGVDKSVKSVVMDGEVANLLIWLVAQQGISPEVAFEEKGTPALPNEEMIRRSCRNFCADGNSTI